MQMVPYSGCCAITIAIGFGQNYDSRTEVSTKEIVKYLENAISLEKRGASHSIILASVIRMQVNAIEALTQVGFVPITGKYRKPYYSGQYVLANAKSALQTAQAQVTYNKRQVAIYERGLKEEGLTASRILTYKREAAAYKEILTSWEETLERNKEAVARIEADPDNPANVTEDVFNRDVTVYAYFLGQEITE